MDMLAWEFSPVFWETECLPQIEDEVRKGRSNGPVFLGAATLATAGVAALYAAILGGPFGVGAEVAAGVAGAVALVAGSYTANGFRKWEKIRLTGVNLATVKRRALFTSTGVIFGPVARLWKGDGYQLVYAGLARSGTSVRLVFTPTFGPVTTLVVPAPPRLKRELPELVRLLELKTPSGRAASRERELAPRPRDTRP